MGAPCWVPSKTSFTPVRKLPCRVSKQRCKCEFPEGAVHAAFNPKMNLVEETFAEIDRVMLKNQRADAKRKKPWPSKGAGKEKFWRRQLRKAVKQVSRNKVFFKKQYTGYKTRCKAFIKSRGKRLRTSKW